MDKKFVLPDKIYRILKWICILYLPIVGLVGDIGNAVGLNVKVVCAIISAIAVAAGAIVKISDSNYYKNRGIEEP